MSRSAAVSRQATAALRMFCTGSSPGAAAATDACASQLLAATPPTTPPAPSRLRTVRRPSSIDPPTLHCDDRELSHGGTSRTRVQDVWPVAVRPCRQRGWTRVAEDAGFEPARALTQHAFQACAIGL